MTVSTVTAPIISFANQQKNENEIAKETNLNPMWIFRGSENNSKSLIDRVEIWRMQNNIIVGIFYYELGSNTSIPVFTDSNGNILPDDFRNKKPKNMKFDLSVLARHAFNFIYDASTVLDVVMDNA